MRPEPVLFEGEAGGNQIRDHVAKIFLHEMRQHEPIVQSRFPAHKAMLVGRPPNHGHERAHEQLLGQAHARMRRHLEIAQFKNALSPRRRVGVVQLVDAELGAMGVAGHVDQKMAK